MKQIMPGVYDDEAGGMHIDIAEMLADNGWPDTPENRATLIAAAHEAFGDRLNLTDEPVEPWVIWSYEHNAWWRPGRWGYTPDLDEAGHYSEAEAKQIEADANIVTINERALSLEEAKRSGP